MGKLEEIMQVLKVHKNWHIDAAHAAIKRAGIYSNTQAIAKALRRLADQGKLKVRGFKVEVVESE